MPKPKPKNTAIPRTVRVDDTRWNAASKKVLKERRSVSEIVRHALDLYVADALPDLPPTGYVPPVKVTRKSAAQ